MPRKRSHILLHVVPFQLAIFGLILIGISDLLPHIDATSDLITNSTGVLPRNKRQYYGDDVYGSYYGCGEFRQAGRIVGWILGFIVLLLIICVPCVCCIGIWFAGWFGLRQAMARRRRTAAEGNTSGGIFSSAGGIIRRTIDPPSPEHQHRVVYAHATDRYFERRPRSPQAHASTNTEYRR